ncbi:discoidin domain-containing protein [Actinokineospora inagensis]|uniref:discoidin domain-containing protein n=1 Tax=Actinokineospora inagensis TaxID=103730 RepID=UPI000479EE67|nr:discoidin domain-containing protein [Actinokineospora inagensis]
MPPGGRRPRVAAPLAATVIGALVGALAGTPAQAEPEPDRVVATDDAQVPVDLSGAMARFWAGYSAGTDVRKDAAIVDALLRAEGPATEPVRHAVRMLAAHAEGDQRRAWCERLALRGVPVPERHAAFTTAALAASDRALGLVRSRPVSTAAAAYTDHVAARMTDGDTSTFYWSAGAPRPGTQFVLDLGRVRPVEEVGLTMGTTARPRDFLRTGVLEGSVDGVGWTTVRRLPGSATVTADLGPAPLDVRYLRLRATAGQRHWLAVREVSVRPGPTDATADGDADTGYTSTGDPLVVPLGVPHPVHRVVVLAGRGTQPGTPVQLRDQSGDWHTVGRVAGEYTDVDARGLVAGQARLLFGPGSTGTVVHEIVERPTV